MHLKSCVGLIILISFTQARQIRINRYETRVSEDSETEIKARVEEIKNAAPYPAAGYRPGRSFSLPGEEESTTEENINFSTTTEFVDVTSTTLEYETTESTTFLDQVPAELASEPQPRQITLVEEDSSKIAPYPAAGYRPRIAFVLPNELKATLQPASLVADTNTTSFNTTDVSKHPPCGVSTNPLHPEPAPGAKPDPDAETVIVESPVGPTIIKAEIPSNIVQIQSQPLVTAPILLDPRTLIYAEQLQNF